MFNSSSTEVKIEASTDDASMLINSGTDGLGVETSYIYFADNSTNKWFIGKDTGNDFVVYDTVRGAAAIEAFTNGNLSLMQSGGDVGIGITSPSGKLHVDGGKVVVDHVVGALGTGSVQEWNSYSGVSGNSKLDLKIGRGSSDKVAIFQATYEGGGYSNIILQDQGGNVGIGTTSPLAKLHVTDSSLAVIKVQETSGNTGASAGALFKTSSNTADSYFKGGILYEDTGNANVIGKLHLVNRTSADTTNANVGDAKLTIGVDGNVGIGTTSPSSRLEVAASATTGVDIAHFSNSNDVVKIKHALDGVGSGITSIFDASNNEDIRLSAQSDSWFNGGDVGIGTNTPDYKLDVAGAIGINTYIHHNDDADTFIGFPAVDNFQVTVANTKELDVSAGIVGITNTLKYDNPTANSEFNGEIVNFGSFLETTAAGDLICLGTDSNSPAWRLANNGNSVDSTGMLGIAMGSSPDDGILVRGHARLAGYSVLADGGKCYISGTDGDMTTTAPSGSGDYLRIVGYVVDSVALSYGHIYFCPDNTWVEIV